MKFGDVTVGVHDDHVAVAEIGRPPDNFFDAGLIGSLADACEWADAEAGARAVVLCSAGKHFCAGADFTGRSGWARAEIATAAPLAVRSIRSTQRAGLAERVREAMAAELAEQDKLRRTADFAEGVRASAERRQPRFEGR